MKGTRTNDEYVLKTTVEEKKEQMAKEFPRTEKIYFSFLRTGHYLSPWAEAGRILGESLDF